MPNHSGTWPNLFIVGAHKAGTTSLYEYLKQHPQIFMSPMKEPCFFSQDRVRLDRDLVVAKERDYHRLFRGSEGYGVVGEASPSYLWHPDVPRRIAERVPDAKIVILLRDPIERAYSHYLMDLRDGGPTAPFYDTIRDQFANGVKVYGTGYLYVDLGLYSEQVKRYLHEFGCDRVLVVMFEDLAHRPAETLFRICRFLKVAVESVKQISCLGTIYMPYKAPRNRLVSNLMRFRGLRLMYRKIAPRELRATIRNVFLEKQVPKPPLDPRAVAFLKSVFESDVAALEILLGRPLGDLRKVW
jgi:hypothetical protein